MAGDSSPLGPGSRGGRELRSGSGTSGERLDRSGFVFLDIEHAVQFGGFQQIEDVDRRLQQLDIGSLIARSRQRTNELPDARTVDVRHACKVEQNLFLALLGQFTNGFAKHETTAGTEGQCLTETQASVRTETRAIARLRKLGFWR